MSQTWTDRSKERCSRYDSLSSRYCRNKVFSMYLPNYGVCKKHLIADLEKYKRENTELIWYLEHRHLLEEEN